MRVDKHTLDFEDENTTEFTKIEKKGHQKAKKATWKVNVWYMPK